LICGYICAVGLHRPVGCVEAGKEFLEGDAFSVSDVAVSAYLLYMPAFLPQV
jgi:hypothetical protein